jgi:hypothetical protein
MKLVFLFNKQIGHLPGGFATGGGGGGAGI